jgi:PKD repeat protein
MARAATTEELALLRSDHQRSKLYLAIYKPVSVYTARVNQSTFDDPVTEITFDGGTGTLDDVLVGMTVLVGTSAGADDKGKVYIRKTPGASTFTISPTSEIGWADNDYLTVLDDFELRTKQPSLAGETLYIDWDVAYDDQHEEFDPVAVMGPHAVLKLTGSTVDFEPDGSDSWVLGSTISAYAWLAPGASATSNLDTDAPTITYNAVGWYRVSLTVTDANGKTATGYRRVYVYNDANLPVENFELVKCMGDVENGGWEFEITLYDEADIADVYPGALCLLFAEDWYGSTKQSLGPIAGYENLVCVGRIDEETIEYDGQSGTVVFAVYGPQGWMKKISSSPAMFTSADDEATSWSEFASPTVDKALFHLLHWRSNATQIMDVFLSGDTRRMPEIDLDIGYIWDQLEILAERRMLAKGCCDRFGRLFVEIPGQLLTTASRSGIATVMAISKDDWTGNINIESQIPQVAMAELAGIRDDTPEQVLMSRAPGSIVKKIGAFESWDGLVFDNQEHANSLSGLFLARENNPYPYVDINLAQNNRMMDVVPNQYVTLSVAPADNPRKITWTNKKLIVKRIELQHDAKAGMLTSELECEADTDGPAGVTVIPPQPMLEGETEIEFPDFEDYSWPGLLPGDWNYNPPFLPPEPVDEDYGIDCPDDAEENGPWTRDLGGLVNISASEYSSITFNYNCVLRSSDHDHKSRYEIHGQFLEWDVDLNGWKQSDKDDFYVVYALDINNNVVATGVKDEVTSNVMRSGTFNNAGNKQIAKIRIEIASSQKLYPELAFIGPYGIYSPVAPDSYEQGIWGTGFWLTFVHEAINVRGNYAYDPGVRLVGTYPAGTRFSFTEVGSVDMTYSPDRIISKLSLIFAGHTNQELSYDNYSMVYNKNSEYVLPIDYLNPAFTYYFETVGSPYSYVPCKTVHYIWCKIAASQEVNFSHFKLYNVCSVVEE